MVERTRATAVWAGRPLGAVLFDLDGTLLDTASDIALALNRTFAGHGWAAFTVTEVSRMVGGGSAVLIERAAAARGHAPSETDQAAGVDRFFEHYAAIEEAHESVASPYPGVGACLEAFHGAGVHVAVVTNKQHRFASALLRRLDLMRWVGVVVGGDTCERRKPDPQPLLYACEFFAIPPTQTLMVGDSVNDVRAARAAHIPVVCVPYGYNEGLDPRSLECDAMIDTLADLPGLVWPRT